MDVREVHRIGFLLGFHSYGAIDPIRKEKNLSMFNMLASYSNASEFEFTDQILSDPKSIVQIFEMWGYETLARIINSGWHWSILAERAKVLMLPISLQDEYLKGQSIEDIISSLVSYLQSNNTHFTLTYFFDFPLKDMVVEVFEEIIAIHKKQSNYSTRQVEYIGHLMMTIVHSITTLIDNGMVLTPERIENQISSRTQFRSQIKSLRYQLVALLLLPPLIVVGLLVSGISLTLENIIVTILSFSGSFSVLGVLSKVLYDQQLPRVKKRVLLRDLLDLGVKKIYQGVVTHSRSEGYAIDGSMEFGKDVSLYPVIKYLLTSRRIGTFDHVKVHGKALSEFL